MVTEKDILQQLSISTTQLSEHMCKQPELFARYAFLAARARDRAENAKVQRKLAEAELDSQLRQEMEAAKEKITEKSVDARVLQHSKYKEAVTQQLKMQMEADILEAAVEAFRSRASMLSSLGAMQRAEMEQQTYLGTPAVSSAQSRSQSVNNALKQKFYEGAKTSP
jgi:hypothetical protein